MLAIASRRASWVCRSQSQFRFIVTRAREVNRNKEREEQTSALPELLEELTSLPQGGIKTGAIYGLAASSWIGEIYDSMGKTLWKQQLTTWRFIGHNPRKMFSQPPDAIVLPSDRALSFFAIAAKYYNVSWKVNGKWRDSRIVWEITQATGQET